MTKSRSLPFSSRIQVPADLFSSFARQQLSERVIAARLAAAGFGVSKSYVHRRLVSLRTGQENTTTKQTKPQKKLTERTKRWLKRQIRVEGHRSTSKLHADLIQRGYSLSVRTVLRHLHSVKTLRLKKPKQRIALTLRHKQQRLEWARLCLGQHIDWSKVLFSDEKVWYTDGPDSRPALWYDIRDEAPTIRRSGTRNTGIHVWGAFSLDYVPELVFLPETYNSAAYCDTVLAKLVANRCTQSLVLYHDRHTVHTSKETQQWLAQHTLQSFLFPPKSADVNLIENVWAIMCREVYPNNKTYDSKEQLACAIRAAWATFQEKRQQRVNLIGSMIPRLHEVVQAKGGLTQH